MRVPTRSSGLSPERKRWARKFTNQSPFLLPSEPPWRKRILITITHFF
jgi:hypothetical protein